MGRRQRVLLDVDGVVANFWSAAEKVVHDVTGGPLPDDVHGAWDMFRSYDKETQNKIYSSFKVEGWCLGLEPYPGAVEFIKELETFANVYFVTSPMSGPFWAYERELWVKKHFGLHHHRVISTNAKYVCVGDVFVDDKFDHILRWSDAHLHGTAVLWDQPYNRQEHWAHRAKSYADVIEVVRAE